MLSKNQIDEVTEKNLHTEIEMTFHSNYAINLIEGKSRSNSKGKFQIQGLLPLSSQTIPAQLRLEEFLSWLLVTKISTA